MKYVYKIIATSGDIVKIVARDERGALELAEKFPREQFAIVRGSWFRKADLTITTTYPFRRGKIVAVERGERVYDAEELA